MHVELFIFFLCWHYPHLLFLLLFLHQKHIYSFRNFLLWPHGFELGRQQSQYINAKMSKQCLFDITIKIDKKKFKSPALFC